MPGEARGSTQRDDEPVERSSPWRGDLFRTRADHRCPEHSPRIDPFLNQAPLPYATSMPYDKQDAMLKSSGQNEAAQSRPVSTVSECPPSGAADLEARLDPRENTGGSLARLGQDYGAEDLPQRVGLRHVEVGPLDLDVERRCRL